MYELSTEYWFDSAHFLTDYNGKCEPAWATSGA